MLLPIEIIFQLGVGFILGLLVGYAIKKLAKVIAVIVGLIILLLLYAEYKGLVRIEYSTLERYARIILERLKLEITGFKTYIISHVPFYASFIVGLALGLKKG